MTVSVIFPERRREQRTRGGFGDGPRPHLDLRASSPAEQSDLFNGRDPSNRLSGLFLSPAFVRKCSSGQCTLELTTQAEDHEDVKLRRQDGIHCYF